MNSVVSQCTNGRLPPGVEPRALLKSNLGPKPELRIPASPFHSMFGPCTKYQVDFGTSPSWLGKWPGTIEEYPASPFAGVVFSCVHSASPLLRVAMRPRMFLSCTLQVAQHNPTKAPDLEAVHHGVPIVTKISDMWSQHHV